MTPLEFFERQQYKAQLINIDHLQYTLHDPKHLVVFLLSINDGFRGLAGYCLSVDGAMIQLE